MADEDRRETERPESEDQDSSGGDEPTGSEESQEGTKPGDWERKPADKDDLRHDDSAEPPPKPLGDDADDDLAEQEAGDITAGDDEGFDRPDPPDETGVGEAGEKLEGHAQPFLEGPEIKTPVGAVPTRSILGIVAFIVVFCIAFFVLWGLLGGIGILVGIVVGAALGLGAMKLLGDRAG